jgi:hypothetical protein
MSKVTTTDLKHKLTDSAEAAKEAASSALHTAAEAGRSASDEIASQAAETLETARDFATGRAEALRDTLADAADHIATRLDSEKDRLTGLSERVLGGLSEGVTSVSDSLRGRSLGDLLADAQGYARRNPGTFALGAAVAGFALARVIGSSSARHQARITADARGSAPKAPRG